MNWLGNPGFETPAGVRLLDAARDLGSWGSCYLSTQYAYTGSQSLVMSGANSGVTQVFSVTAGAAYTESVYAMTPAGRSATGSIDAEMQFFFYNSSGTMLSSYSPPNRTIVAAAQQHRRLAYGERGQPGLELLFQHGCGARGRGHGGRAACHLRQFHLRRSGVLRMRRRSRPTSAGLTVGSSSANGTLSNSGTIVIGSPDAITVNGTYTQASTGVLTRNSAAPATNQYLPADDHRRGRPGRKR